MTRLRLRWLTALALVLLSALAGCNGGDGGQSEVVDVSNLETEALEEGSFFLDISGDVEIGFVSSDFNYRAIGQVYEIALTAPDSGYSLSILHFGYPDDGAYPLQSLDTTPDAPNLFSVGLLSLTSPLPEQQFNTNIRGTITVQVEDTLVTGSFEFVAANGNGEGSVVVRGGFKGLPVGGG